MSFDLIEAKTTGFSSPAIDYIEKRLGLDGIDLEDPFFSFFFRVGPSINYPSLRECDVLVINRKKDPQEGKVCLGVDKSGEFVLYRKGNAIPDEHWGVVERIIRLQNG
jgi:hypothetical protein